MLGISLPDAEILVRQRTQDSKGLHLSCLGLLFLLFALTTSLLTGCASVSEVSNATPAGFTMLPMLTTQPLLGNIYNRDDIVRSRQLTRYGTLRHRFGPSDIEHFDLFSPEFDEAKRDTVLKGLSSFLSSNSQGAVHLKMLPFSLSQDALSMSTLDEITPELGARVDKLCDERPNLNCDAFFMIHEQFRADSIPITYRSENIRRTNIGFEGTDQADSLEILGVLRRLLPKGHIGIRKSSVDSLHINYDVKLDSALVFAYCRWYPTFRGQHSAIEFPVRIGTLAHRGIEQLSNEGVTYSAGVDVLYAFRRYYFRAQPVLGFGLSVDHMPNGTLIPLTLQVRCHYRSSPTYIFAQGGPLIANVRGISSDYKNDGIVGRFGIGCADLFDVAGVRSGFAVFAQTLKNNLYRYDGTDQGNLYTWSLQIMFTPRIHEWR